MRTLYPFLSKALQKSQICIIIVTLKAPYFLLAKE